MYKSVKDVISKYALLRNKAIKNNYTLSDLSDSELHLYITAKTLEYGRTLFGSIENADCHLKDRKFAELIFSRKHTDDFMKG
jgi:hypothetical protein